MNYNYIFYGLIENLFSFFLLDLFITHQTKLPTKQKQFRPYFIFFYIIYSFISVSNGFLIGYLLDLSYIYLTSKISIFKKVLILLKYYLYIQACNLITIVFHLLLFQDLEALATNSIYMQYNAMISVAFTYILACLYINRKKLRSLNVGKSYIYQYNLISITALAVMMISTLLLEAAVITPDDLVPVIFALILVIVAVCLSNYRKVVLTMEENAMNKIQLEKDAMELDYNTQIEKNLQELHTLRHDMKNHLLLIDSLASNGNIEKIHDYVYQIHHELSQTKTITTASTTISSLLNAKKLLCEEQKITLQMELNLSDIYLDDFTIITVLGNLLDNAITAAGKLADGYIHLHIEQIDTYLAVDCANNHIEKIVKKEGRFISSKPSVNLNQNSRQWNHPTNPVHGLGIISLTNTVEKNGGTVQTDYDDHTFSIHVLIPNYAH